MRVVIVTLDSHLASAVARANEVLANEMPGLAHHAPRRRPNGGKTPNLLDDCLDDIATGDIILTTMLFIEEHIQAVLPALKARRDHCDAMIACMSAGEVAKITKMGGFNMDGTDSGVMSLLKRLKPKRKRARRPRPAAQARWRCCAGCRRSCDSFPAPPRTCAPIS